MPPFDDPDDRQPDPSGAAARRRVDLLYRAEAPALARRLRRRVGSPDDAREIVHDAFARLLDAPSFTKIVRPEAFLNRIIRNLLLDRSKRPSTRAVHVPIGEAHGLAVPADQHHAVELSEMREHYRSAVAALPPRMREVFMLHRVEELSYKEIAARLQIGVRTVETHLAEAIVRIDRDLKSR